MASESANIREATRFYHPDPRMRGRRYAIPFHSVWTRIVELVGEAEPRWHLISSEEDEGVIRIEVRTGLLGWVDDVEIRVQLDQDAQTRVDMESASRVGVVDFGTNGRRIRRFLNRLDGVLDAGPTTILPPEGGGATFASDNVPTSTD